MKTALIIGGGFAGCAAAHQFALEGGWDVTLVEASDRLGAGVRTSWLGGHPYTFGPRHFLTQRQDVWDYMNKYVPLRRCSEHEFLTYVETDREFYNYPIHEDDISRMPEREIILHEKMNGPHYAKYHDINPANFEEFWVYSVGPILYDKFINTYSKKMWDIEDNRILDTFSWSPKGTTLKSGPRASWDTALSGYPLARNGYDDYFKIATKGTKILYESRAAWFPSYNDRWYNIRGEHKEFDIVVNTVAPDRPYYEEKIGELVFMGRDIVPLVLPVEFALPPDVYMCYYAGMERYTRVTEYKKFTQHRDSSSTLITLEYPSKNGRLYPMPIRAEQEKAQRYFDLMPDNVYSIGRAGSYDYSVDMDDCIAQAMEMMKQIKVGGRDHPVPLRRF